VYNSKEQFSALVNGWEIWEPNNKTKKDRIRTKWRRKEQDNNNKRGEEKRLWWKNEDQGYASDLELNAEYDLDKITCDKVVQELGEYEEEEAGREQEEDGSVKNDVDDDDEDDEDKQNMSVNQLWNKKTAVQQGREHSNGGWNNSVYW
jgi:hypothetical protein